MTNKQMSVDSRSRKANDVDWRRRYEALKRERDRLIRDLVVLQAERESHVRMADQLLGATYYVDVGDEERL